MMSQPAILLLGSQMAVGGAQHVLLLQAGWFHAHGRRVVAAFVYDREGLCADWQARYPFPIIDLKAYCPGSPLFNILRMAAGLLRLAGLMVRFHIRAVETFTPHANLFGLPVAFLMGVPRRVATYHGRPNNYPPALEKLHTWLVKSGLSTAFVAVSPSARADAVQAGIPANRITIIPNGVIIPSPSAAAPDLRARLGLPGRGDIVLSVGRLIPQKAHLDLVRAIPAVLAQYPEAVFLIAGEGPLRGDLETEIEALGLSGRARLLGNRTDIQEIMLISSLFVLTSVSEGLPMAVLEAMACGLAVIGTGVLAEILEDNVTGLLVPEGDAPALARAVTALLRDLSRRQALAAAGRELVRKKYTVEAMCAGYAGLLLDPAEEAPGGTPA